MNVVLIAIDTLRADHMGCYGYHRNTSPNIDRFAKEGVVFENFFAPSVPTTPSFTSIFTSRDAIAHQTVNVAGDHELSPKIKLLPEILQKHGYVTAAVDNLGRWYSRGYDRYVTYKRQWQTEKGRVDPCIEIVNEKALPMIDELAAARKRFFLFIHTWDPHTPYWPPKPYGRMFYRKPRGAERDPKNTSMKKVYAFGAFGAAYRNWFGEDLTDTECVIAQYDGEIRYCDTHLQKIFDRMKKGKLWNDTLVIILSDHGEILDDHTGQFDHHGLYEGVLRVPLIMRHPKKLPAGKRIEAMTQNIDVAPTILKMLGLPVPRNMEGSDLMPLIRGRKKELYREIYISEATYQLKRGVRTKEWKLIKSLRPDWHGGPKWELYNLAADPEEQTNVAYLYPMVVRELSRRLDTWVERNLKKYGYEDPILAQGTSIGKRLMKTWRKKLREAPPQIV